MKRVSWICLALFISHHHCFAQFEENAEVVLFKAFQAPDFILTDINGKEISLKQYQGKVVYLEFWATWCGACRKNMKNVDRLKKKFDTDTNVVFIQVSTDKEKNRWEQFVKERKPSGIQLYTDTDKGNNVRVKYDVKFLPKTFLINSEGFIVIDPDKIEIYNIEKEIMKLLRKED